MDFEAPPAEPASEGSPAWMATFGDLMSLLLCFFVLLLSFANMDVVKFKQMMGSMREALGVQAADPGLIQAGATSQESLAEAKLDAVIEMYEDSERERTQDDEIAELFQKAIETRGLEDQVEVEMGERGVTIRADGQLMFEAGSEALRPEAHEVLDQIAQLAALYPYKIAVEGHTDDTPIQTARFPSNWELSAARALSGLRYLVDAGGVPPEIVSAAGFADTRPLVDAKTRDARARNRRVEFVFYQE